MDNRLVLDNDGMHESRSVVRRAGLSWGLHRLKVQSFSTTSEPFMEFSMTGASLTGLVSAKWLDTGWVAAGSTLTQADGSYAFGSVARGATVRAVYPGWVFVPGSRVVTGFVGSLNFAAEAGPRLTIHRQGSQVVLEWPKTGVTYSVQTAGGISHATQGIDWVPMEVEILESLTHQRVVVPVVDQKRWFRLVRLR